MSGEKEPGGLMRTEVVMGTLVSIQVVRAIAGSEDAMARAFGWFFEIEKRCTRFDEQSELMQLTGQAGVPVTVSPILFETVQFALMVAKESGGAFDPTVGHQMMSRGFNREHRSGNAVASAIAIKDDVTFRDVELDPDRRTIRLVRPLTLDLGAVAKGLAVDLAAREIEQFQDFAIDAGGDLYLGGHNPQGNPWSVGIRHPRHDGELIDSLCVSNQAVCTSGDYERRSPAAGHHILDPRTGESARGVASATVVAPGAMLADALATAAFVLGPEVGLEFLTRLGATGLVVTRELRRYETPGLCHAA